MLEVSYLTSILKQTFEKPLILLSKGLKNTIQKQKFKESAELDLAYGVAGLAGPLLAGYFKDAAQGAAQPSVWMTPFVIAGALCLLGALVMSLTRRPRIDERPASSASNGNKLASQLS